MLGINAPLPAVPYASGVRQDGDTVSFILNEPADTVTITRNFNDTFLVLNNVAAGEHTFDLAGVSDYTISVTNSAPAGWAEISTSVGNPMLNFERANGVAVNNNPGSPNFGRFYVSQRDGTVSQLGRQMGDGIYVFNADATDAFGITDPNDPSAARNAGLDFSGTPGSPFRISVGPDDTLYIGDASDIHGGIYYTDPDVTTGGNLLAGLGGVQPIVERNHGSIISTPLISGSLAGGDLVLYTIDQDLPGSVPNTGSHVWRYDIGGTANYAGTPTLALDASTIGTNSDGSSILTASNSRNYDAGYDLPPNFLADITRDPRTGNFIIMQLNRGLLVMDPTLSTILFNSQQFYIDNEIESGIFRQSASAVVSPDGKYLFFRNYYLGGVFVATLDDDGLPILDATQGSSLGLDYFTAPTPYSGTPRAPIIYDLAGNIYTAGNLAASERLGIYSPGGDTVAVTRSNGTFTINGTTYGDHLEGDLNNDGFVGIIDLSIILGNWNEAVAHGVFTLGDPSGDGFVGIEDLNVVLSNWNAGTPPGETANIPEPGGVFAVVSGLISLAGRRGRGYR
ncbi:MAG: hypothetical protein R3C45_12995 [Phycisphaerales bacterium]